MKRSYFSLCVVVDPLKYPSLFFLSFLLLPPQVFFSGKSPCFQLGNVTIGTGANDLRMADDACFSKLDDAIQKLRETFNR